MYEQLIQALAGSSKPTQPDGPQYPVPSKGGFAGAPGFQAPPQFGGKMPFRGAPGFQQPPQPSTGLQQPPGPNMPPPQGMPQFQGSTGLQQRPPSQPQPMPGRPPQAGPPLIGPPPQRNFQPGGAPNIAGQFGGGMARPVMPKYGV